MTKLVKREAVFIPIKELKRKEIDRIKEKHTFHFYEEKACKKCDNLPQRPNDICEGCAAYKGSYMLASEVKVKEKKWLKIPVGSAQTTADYLVRKGHEVKWVDKSPKTKIAKIKFTGTLSEGQEKAVTGILNSDRRGVLRAPPRAGKTVMSAAIVCRLRRKTLIVAAQRDWLMGFMETFVGSKTQKPLTDLDPKRIKLCKKYEDFLEHDICLATIQTFYSEGGQKLLRKLRDVFDVVFIDEVHTAAADKYVSIMSKLNAAIVIGLSGTPDRKDGKYVLVDQIIGPVLYTMDFEGMRPRIHLTRTKYRKDYKGNVPWTRMVSSLENDKQRLKLIAKTALADIANGHLVMIPFAQVKPINKLVAIINKLAGKQVAYPFTGQLKKTAKTNERDDTIQKARKYKIKCLVGTLKIMSTGINIPRASMLYEATLSSNMPNAEQRMRRVLTKMDDKPQPGIRYFLDDMNVRKNCMRNEYYRVMVPKMKPIVSEKDKAVLESYFKEKKADTYEF